MKGWEELCIFVTDPMESRARHSADLRGTTQMCRQSGDGDIGACFADGGKITCRKLVTT